MNIDIVKSARTGLDFVLGNKHIWVNQKSGPNFERYYMYAELVDGFYINHKEFKELEDAIFRMIS